MHKKLHRELAARSGDLFKKFYLKDFNDLQRKYNINDINDPIEFNSFVKNYWIKLNIELDRLKIHDACNELDIRGTGQGSGVADKFSIINEKLSKETATADVLLLTPANLPSSDLVGKYHCKQNSINSYFIYLHIAESGIDQDHKDFVAIVANGQKIIKSTIIPYPHFTSQNEDDINIDFCNDVYNAFKRCNQFIIDEINNNNPNNYTYEFNPPSSENDIRDNIKYLLDTYLYNSMQGEDEYYVGLNYQSPITQNNNNMNSFNTELKIQVYYSHIDILNKIMQKCQKEKVKYRFDRIASSIKRLLYKKAFMKYAIKNNELLQTFNKVCDTNNTRLVATYYAKKLEDENNQLDENYCAGIIIQFNNIFLTLPSHAYSSFYNIINEYNRKKDELNNRSIFKKVKDTITNNGEKIIDSIFPNNISIADIAANPYINKNKAIYKYIINHVNGVKEFSSFAEANIFLKKYTSAQYIKLESAFNYLNNNDTQVQEHILQLTLNFTSNNKLYQDIKKIINDNQKYILNINDVKQAMQKIISLNRLKK